MPTVVEARLRYRAPMEAQAVIDYLARRAIPGVEDVAGGRYRRSLALDHGAGVAEFAAADGHVLARYRLEDERDLEEAVSRSRVLFDLDRDPSTVLAALGDAPLIGPSVRATPGRRIPGHVDAHEIAVRAVLGQQVSLSGAATLAGRLVADYGEPLAEPWGTVTHLFPSAAVLAAADPQRLPMPGSRRRALLALTAALASGRVAIGPDADPPTARVQLLELPGIGPWTADYVALRALRDPDAFLAGDLGVRRALEALGEDGTPRNAARIAQRWRPFRAYALMHLWARLSPTVSA
jgi:AraC family transcriptional regulator, regulatory protein of adaptative response / DNA-3-methyladenine glycosylase II